MGVLAAACCIGLLLVSGLISGKNIEKNAKLSAEYFENNSLFEEPVKNQPAVKRDNYADCISFCIAYQFGNRDAIEGTDRRSLFTRVLEARYTQAEGENVNDGFSRAVNEGAKGNVTYSRYWHGGAAVIRLLMLLFSVRGMRILFLVSGILLNLLWIGYLIWKKEYAMGISYTCGIFFGKLFFAYTCLEYAFVCLMIPVFSFLVYRSAECNAGKRNSKGTVSEGNSGRNGLSGWNGLRVLPTGAFFLVFGILTCFFDFLTAETLTFTVPMFVLLFCLTKNKKKYTILKEGETAESLEKARIRSLWKTFLTDGFLWLLGYAGMFCFKWILSFLFLGGEEGKTALFYIAERTVGEVHVSANLASPTVSFPVRIAELLLRNLSCLAGIPDHPNRTAQVLILCGIAVVIGLLWFFLRKPADNKKGKKAFTSFPVLMTLVFVPFLRFWVLSNHSYMHYFFTYRALMTGVMVLVYCFMKTTILDSFTD